MVVLEILTGPIFPGSVGKSSRKIHGIVFSFVHCDLSVHELVILSKKPIHSSAGFLVHNND
jgi:hypothetical protein